MIKMYFCNKKKILNIKILSLIILSILLIIVDNYTFIFKESKNRITTIISIFHTFHDKQYQIISLLYNNITLYKSLNKKISILKKELMIAKYNLKYLNSCIEENNRLRQLFNLPLHLKESKIIAEITSIVSDNVCTYNVWINKGTLNGIHNGQTVINNTGIVGQIILSEKITSKILSIYDMEYSMLVKDNRSNIYAIMHGDGYGNDTKLEYLPFNSDIRVGDKIVTSSVDNYFPSNYPIGVVSLVQRDNISSRLLVKIHPYLDMSSLSYVLVLDKRM